MKASVRWLRELCPRLPDDPRAIAERMTSAGIEIEGTTEFGQGTEACVVASVVSVRPHPSRSGLRLVTVDRGGATQEVVCGAPNVPEPGGRVVLAPIGTHLPAKGMTIESRAIGGVTSDGMLCSEAELGLGDEGGGILILPSTLAPGTPLRTALPCARDTILEVGLGANRPDGLGHVGLAREAAALFEVPFLLPRPELPANARDAALTSYVNVTIEDAERCPHYGAAVLVGARVGPSPVEVRWRLSSLGVRPISNLVDVTNLVMLEAGHPMHAFDLDKVRGARIVVRRATEGEKLVTLDGVERTLTADDLVICDGEGPVALAGVMGGGNSEIGDGTARVLLECAYFDPPGVRRAGRRHGLHTESSHRFERGVDHGDTAWALARAVELCARLSGAVPVKEQCLFEARALPPRSVTLRHDRIGATLGAHVPSGDAHAILDRLGFACQASEPGQDTWLVPTFRPDVSREIDLIEEIGRVRGYDRIPATLPPVQPSRDAALHQGWARKAREAGVALGLSEAVTLSFASPRELEALAAPKPAVALQNPLNETATVMRTSLLPGLLRALGHARRHGERNARLFTVASVFLSGDGPLPEERLSFAALLAGERPAWLHKPEAVDVWDAKGVAEGLVQRLLRKTPAVTLATGEARPARLHPRGAALLHVDGQAVGSFGPLHPDVLAAFDLDEGALVVEVDLVALRAAGAAPVRFASIPRFPASTRDLAVVVKDGVLAGEVEAAVRQAAGELAEQVALFDRFAGGSVPAGHASLALHVVYRAGDRTLTDAEVDQRHAHVVAEVQRRFGAQLRA